MKKICLSLLIVFLIFSLIIVGKSQAVNTVDDVMDGAAGFITEGEKDTIRVKDEDGTWKEEPYNTTNESILKDASDFLYNLLLGIGIIVAVIVGVIIGIKFMMGSIEEKAEYKEMLLPYLISCAVVFGAFGIWKIVVNILIKI